MTALEASASTRTRAAIRAQAQIIDHVTVSDRLVHDVLLGWPARADSVRVVLDAARASGVDVATVPARTEAERAEWTAKRQGKRPCPACITKDAELEKLRDLAQRETAKLVGQLELAHQDLAVVRARVAELEARPVAAPEPRRQERETRLRERGYDQDPPKDPFVAPQPPPQPDATTRALERAVGRPCTVRVDMGDGVLVRAAEAAGHCGHSEAEAVIAQGRARVGDGTVTTPAEAAG